MLQELNNTHQSRFPRTPSPWPQTAGWLLCRSHRPGAQQIRGQRSQTTTEDNLRQSKKGSPDLLVFLQSHAGLCCVWGLDEDQLVPLDVLQDALQRHTGTGRGQCLLNFQILPFKKLYFSNSGIYHQYQHWAQF